MRRRGWWRGRHTYGESVHMKTWEKPHEWTRARASCRKGILEAMEATQGHL